jgi:hypothetical protein
MFRVESLAPQYQVMDPTDISPATVHVFFEQKGDDLINPDGRWWAGPSVYNLGSQDNATLTIFVPFTPDYWSNVYGKKGAEPFYTALGNIGWIGVTCGGQDFWGHGVELVGGRAKYVLLDFQVD